MPSAIVQSAARLRRQTETAQALRLGTSCALVTFALYISTAAPGVCWQDSGVHQYRILTHQVENPIGLALSHPLHHWLGRAGVAAPLPFTMAPFRLNVMSGLFGALAAGALAFLVARLTRSVVAALLATAALVTAHSFWQMSVVTETYTLAAALMVLEWCLLLRYARTRQAALLVALFAVNGLHVANHLLGLLTLVTYIVLVVERVWRRRLAPAWLLPCALAWLVACAPYWMLVLAHYQRGGDLAATVHSALFGGGGDYGGYAQNVLNTGVSLAQLKLAALTLGYSFPSLVVPLALVGMLRPARPRRRIFRRVLIAQTIVICGFVARYNVLDLYTFFVPVCVLAALWFGLGADRVLRAVSMPPASRVLRVLLVANAVLPIAVYLVFPDMARARGWMRGRLRDIPFRDEYAHFFEPWQHGRDSAGRFGQHVLERAGPGGWVLADGTTAYPAACTLLVEGGPPGVRIYSGRTCLNVGDIPPLSTARLASFVGRGGNAIVVPGVAQRLWLHDFAAEPGAHGLQRITAVRPGTGLGTPP